MAKVIEKMRKNVSVRLAIISGLAVTLSGCAYGYGDVGYYAGGYASECDPYNEFDSYYDCDNRFGFVNIGYGGGWHDNYYYPGHGLYLFDSYGRRYNLHDNYRRYWAQQRYSYYQNRARQYGGGHHNGGQHHGGGQYDGGGQYHGGQHGGQQHHNDGQYSGVQNGHDAASGGRRVRNGIARDLARDLGGNGGSGDTAQSAARNAAGGGVAASAGRPFRNFTPGGNDTQGNAQPRSSVRQQAAAAAQAASSQASVRQVQQPAASAPERQQRAEPAARPSPPARAAQPSNRQPNQGANQRTGGRVQDF